MLKRFSLKKFLLAAGTSIRRFFTFEESAEGRRRRRELFILAGIFCVLAISAILVGVSDNIPRIILCYLAAITLIVALTRTWKRTKTFLILLGASENKQRDNSGSPEPRLGALASSPFSNSLRILSSSSKVSCV